MYSITPEHAIGLVGGLLALAVVLFARRLHPRWRLVPGTVQAAAVLMAVSGGVHLALIPHHLATQPLTSALFLVNGLMFIALSASFTWRHWRLASGALLQSTNAIPTPEQVAAANRLYAETKAAIQPYEDWRKAWAAGYRPGGSTTLPSTHWMNQRYVDEI